jgi:hypothetical protein
MRARDGRLSFFHYDPYSQALPKLERAHVLDLEDVQALIERGLVDRQRALRHYKEIEPEPLPGCRPRAFRRRIEETLRQ